MMLVRAYISNMALENTVLAWSTQVPPICRVYEGQPMERALASWMMVLKGEELKGLLSDRGAALKAQQELF